MEKSFLTVPDPEIRHGRAPDGHIIAFGAAAGEVDLILAAMQGLCNACAGRVDPVPVSYTHLSAALCWA